MLAKPTSLADTIMATLSALRGNLPKQVDRLREAREDLVAKVDPMIEHLAELDKRIVAGVLDMTEAEHAELVLERDRLERAREVLNTAVDALDQKIADATENERRGAAAKLAKDLEAKVRRMRDICAESAPMWDRLFSNCIEYKKLAHEIQQANIALRDQGLGELRVPTLHNRATAQSDKPKRGDDPWHGAEKVLDLGPRGDGYFTLTELGAVKL